MQYMKLIFIITYCLMITISSNAMDYPNRFDLNTIEEITTVKEPWHVRYITDKRLAVLGKDGCCSIFDLKTKESQCIATGNLFASGFPILEINNNKIIVAHGTKVTIYNGETGKNECIILALKTVSSLTLYPRENTLFLCCEENEKAIEKHNYVSNKYEDITILDQYCQLTTIHPQKEIICIAAYSGKISLRKLDNITAPLKTISLPTQPCFFCEYNLDGSRIIAGNKQQLYIIDPDDDTALFPSLTAPKYTLFEHIVFHPNGLILATLSNSLDFVINYWNLKTQQLINRTSIASPAHNICFSVDGLQVVAAFKDKCVRALVPFAVKEKYSYLLFVLNQLKKQNKLPKDIVQYCMHLLLKHICL